MLGVLPLLLLHLTLHSLVSSTCSGCVLYILLLILLHMFLLLVDLPPVGFVSLVLLHLDCKVLLLLPVGLHPFAEVCVFEGLLGWGPAVAVNPWEYWATGEGRQRQLGMLCWLWQPSTSGNTQHCRVPCFTGVSDIFFPIGAVVTPGFTGP